MAFVQNISLRIRRVRIPNSRGWAELLYGYRYTCLAVVNTDPPRLLLHRFCSDWLRILPIQCAGYVCTVCMPSRETGILPWDRVRINIDRDPLSLSDVRIVSYKLQQSDARNIDMFCSFKLQEYLAWHITIIMHIPISLCIIFKFMHNLSIPWTSVKMVLSFILTYSSKIDLKHFNSKRVRTWLFGNEIIVQIRIYFTILNSNRCRVQKN